VLSAVHLILLTEHGIHLMENMRLCHLVADLRDAAPNEASGRSPFEFLFVFAPVTQAANLVMTPEALRLRHEPAADCARYDSLRRASG